MKQRSRGAALAALFVAGFLPFPLISGLHLVSNQPTGTDNQNNPPVHYVPKMASKLGLPPPQNREPEVLTDETLISAVRQLMESNKRQTAFLERLAALAPRSKTEKSSQQKTPRKPTTRPSQSATKNTEHSVIMRPSKHKPEENVKPPEPVNNPENGALSNTTVEKTPVQSDPAPNYVQLPPKTLLHHRQFVSPAHGPGPYPHFSHFISEAPHSQIPHFFQVSPPNFVATQRFSQNTNIPQESQFHFVGAVPHSQNSHSRQEHHPNFVGKAPSSLNENILQVSHSHLVGETSHNQNVHIPQGPHVNFVGEVPHSQSHHNHQEYYPNFVGKAPPSLNQNIPQGSQSNFIGETSHAQNPEIVQASRPNFVVKPLLSQSPRITQGPQSNIVGEAPHSHIPRHFQGSHPNFVSTAPQNSQIPQGFYHFVGGAARIHNPLFLPQGQTPLKGQYSSNPYAGDPQPTNVISHVPNNYVRNFLVNPQPSDLNAQYPNLLQKRYQVPVR